MSLQTELCLRAAHIGEAELLKLMGYRRFSIRHRERLRAVLADPMLGLPHSGFDFRFSNKDFVRELARVLGVDALQTQRELRRLDKQMDEVAQRFSPLIWVDTGFKRSSQAIFALAACEHFRYVPFSDAERSLYHSISMGARVDLVCEKVRRHYKENDGFLGIWGYIQRYYFHYSEEAALILLSDGSIHKEVASTPHGAHATLSVKNKAIQIKAAANVHDGSDKD